MRSPLAKGSWLRLPSASSNEEGTFLRPVVLAGTITFAQIASAATFGGVLGKFAASCGMPDATAGGFASGLR